MLLHYYLADLALTNHHHSDVDDSVVSAGDFAPTRQSYEVFQAVSDEIEPHLVNLRDTIDKDVSDFDNLVHELGIPAVVGRP